MAQKKKPRHVGLARALSKLGYCSRSQAARLIQNGRVRLNGSTSRNPETPVRLGSDRIEVDKEAVKSEAKVYLILNKPRGEIRLYYGGADTCLALATAQLSDLLGYLGTCPVPQTRKRRSMTLSE